MCDEFETDTWGITDDDIDILLSATTIYISSIAIMPATACSVSFEAYFSNTVTVAIDYEISTGTDLHTIDVSTTYEPSWCSFVSSETYYFITDLTTMAQNDNGDVQLAFSAGQLSVTSTETSLIGTSRDYYMTKDVNNDTIDLYLPI